jgi:hypothetical protein
MTHNRRDLDALSSAKRLLLVRSLWDSLVDSAEPTPLTPSELRLLEVRVAYADRIDAEWFSLKQILADRADGR